MTKTLQQANIGWLGCIITVILFLSHLLEHLFNLKFAAKDLERNAKKSEKQEKEEKDKLKKVGNGYFKRVTLYTNQIILYYICLVWTRIFY